MSRRKSYTQVFKSNQVRADHVKGKSDIGYRGFQCLNPSCTQFIVWPEPIEPGFTIPCNSCGYMHEWDGTAKFFDYQLQRINPETSQPDEIIDSGEFLIDHRAYVLESLQYKYCIVCNALKPYSLFDRHSGRTTGHQGECNLCKSAYNNLKNPTRLADQHRESAQKRRLYIQVSGESGRIDSKEIFKRFNNRCFQCNCLLVDEAGNPLLGEFHIDHTLPAFYLWPVKTETATLLCSIHNGEKTNLWPNKYYSPAKLRELSVITGLTFELISGNEKINPEAIEYLSNAENVESMLIKYAKYKGDLLRLRNRVLQHTGHDFFKVTARISTDWIAEADALLAG